MMTKIDYRDVAKAINREPKYTQTLLSRRKIKMKDLLGLSKLIIEYYLK